MRPLKVLIVVEPGTAGTFGHVEGLVHFLIEQGQQVFLAYSDKRAGPNVPALLDFVTRHGGKCLNLKVGNAPCVGDISAFFRLMNITREFNPDIIHSHSSKAGVLARSLALFGVKGIQIYTPHAYYGLASRRDMMEMFYNKIETVFGHIGQTINVSEDERLFAIQQLHIDAERCLLIPIAVDTSKFTAPNPDAKKRAREILGLPAEAVVLGWMGRLSYQKDPETLYRAFGMLLRKETNPCHLLMVGQGDDQKKLDQLAREYDFDSHLTRIAYLPNSAGHSPNTLDFYHAVDGLILNSRYEGCPTTAIEALASDLPVILSTAPGTNWLTRSDLSHCWSAAPGDAEGFADAISLWLADLPRRRPSNHRKFALQRLSIADMYGQVLASYRTQAANLS